MMSTKTVRMDETEEKLLERVQRLSGLSASDAIKQGLALLDEKLRSHSIKRAWEIYAELDLGAGGYAAGPARNSRRVATEAIRRRAKR